MLMLSKFLRLGMQGFACEDFACDWHPDRGLLLLRTSTAKRWGVAKTQVQQVVAAAMPLRTSQSPLPWALSLAWFFLVPLHGLVASAFH